MNPTIAAILGDLERELGALPSGDLPAALAELERLKLQSLPRLLAPQAQGGNGSGPEKLLTAAEAARILGVGTDFLYRNARKLPFRVELSPGRVRYSPSGIEKYSRDRQNSS